MADAPAKPQRQRRTRRRANTEIVEINIDTPDKGTVSAAGQRKRSRRRFRRRNRRPVFGPWLPGQAPKSRLRRAIKREIKREGLDGPRVSVQQRVSSTFGLVGPNKNGNVELELNFFLHPSLAKEANDGTSFGPVQALAAQYSLWKLKYLKLSFTPMVGASAVSGTVVRASLNLSQSPGGTNWSGLGTRQHLDIHPGQSATFFLRGDQIGGPRDGGWWLTDTNEEGSQSAGPIIEVHTLGKTESTFTGKPWESSLFIVEGLGVWQFANYQVKPALGMLERRQETVPVTMKAVPGQPITMELPVAATLTRFMLNAEPESIAIPATADVGETIFQIVDVGADLATKFTPPPFSWLIKGGWWFLKRAFGKARDAQNATFNVYSSLADAQNNRPAIAGSSAVSPSNPINAELIVTQMNAPNVGPQPTSTAAVRSVVPVPLESGTFRLHAHMYPMESISWTGESGNAYPTSWIIGNAVAYPTTGQANGLYYIRTNWYISKSELYSAIATNPTTAGAYVHTVYKLDNLRFSDSSGNVEFLPPTQDSGAGLFHGNDKKNPSAAYHKLGNIVATAKIENGNSNYLGMVLSLVHVTATHSAGFEESGYQFFRMNQVGTTSQAVKFKQNENITASTIRTIEIRRDDYLLCVTFAAEGNTAPTTGFSPISKLDGTNTDMAVALPFKKAGSTSYQTDDFYRLDFMQNLESPYGVPYGMSGQLMPTFSIDQAFTIVPPKNQELFEQLLALGFKPASAVPDELPPLEFQADSDTDSDDSESSLVDFLKELLEAGRLPNGAEIAYRAGDYALALQRYEDM